MSKKFALALGVCSLLMLGNAFAGCGEGGCGDGFGNCDASEFENVCQCTDPVCNSSDRGCLSKAECCEAFGNMGAR